MLTPAATVLLVGLASGAASTVLAWAHLFDRLRPSRPPWAAYLSSCPVCIGGWISLALTALQGVPEGLSPLVAWWAAWGVSCLVAAGMAGLADHQQERDHGEEHRPLEP